MAGKREIDFHFLAHPKNECAGVLQTPFDVRNRKVDLRGAVRSINVNLGGDCEVVRRPVKSKGAGDLYR